MLQSARYGNSDQRTEVSKSNAAVKRVLAATIGSAWKGRRVVVIEAQPKWSHTDYIDDHTKAWYVNLDKMTASPTRRPTYGGPAVELVVPEGSYEALVIWQRFQGSDMGVEIVVPQGAIDPGVVATATDALLAGDKKAAARVTAESGAVAGLALAIAEARAKSLAKGEELVRTGEQPSGARKRQLDREIAEAMLRR